MSTNIRHLPKVFEFIEGESTKITLPTRYRDSFSRYLAKRKLILEPPYTTEVWNGVESAYTNFVLPVRTDVADVIFDDWIDEWCEAADVR